MSIASKDARAGAAQAEQCRHRPPGEDRARDSQRLDCRHRRSPPTRRARAGPAPEEARRAARSARGRAHSALRLLAGAALDSDRGAGCHIATLDTRIEEAMAPFAEAAALLQTMPGVAARAAQAMLAETGVDMAPFPTAGHFASWARLCPGNHESAGKRQPTTTGKGATWLRATLQEVAWAAVRRRKATTGRSTTGSKGGGAPKRRSSASSTRWS